MKRLLLIAVALVIYGSLYPWDFVFSRAPGILPWTLLHWPDHFDRYIARDLVLNVVLYVPIGIGACLGLGRGLPRAAALALSLLFAGAVSTAMELLQVYVPGRDPSFADIASNVLGGLIGAAMALWVGPAIERRLAPAPRPDAGGAALLAGFWAIAGWYPFFPAISRHHLALNVAALGRGGVSAAELFRSSAEWFAAGVILAAALPVLRKWWPAAAPVLFLSRMLIAERVVTAGEAAGAAVSVALWVAIPETARRRAAAWLMAIAVVVRELAPFRFSPHAAAFSWVPFQATFHAERQGAAVVLAGKAFAYGATLWLLRRSGMPRWAAGLSVTAGLLALELAQRYIPGRTPEITDAVVAALAGFLLWGLERRGSEGSGVAAAGRERAAYSPRS